MSRKSRANAAAPKKIADLTHAQATRKNIPTVEHQPAMLRAEPTPRTVHYPRGGAGNLTEEKAQRDADLDPQLVWRGKEAQDRAALAVAAPPLYIQEKVKPKALIDALRREAEARRSAAAAAAHTPQQAQLDLFGDFNGLPEGAERTEFYQHEGHWQNRMILGDSLSVMASLAECEGQRGKAQCIYFDPPYGIKFNSNFQWSTRSSNVKDGHAAHITREPEQVKAFRDTWKDGIHSYLSYLRDRLTVARDLLTDSGSIFVQIGDENVHRVRDVMDEVFGEGNCVSQIAYAKTTGFPSGTLANIADYILWYAKDKKQVKYRPLYTEKRAGDVGASKLRPVSTISSLANSTHDFHRPATLDQLTSQGGENRGEQFAFRNRLWSAPKGLHWKTTIEGIQRLILAERVSVEGKTPRYVRFLEDFPVAPLSNLWLDIGGVQSRTDPKVYVVQTGAEAVKRCLLMATDPGDLVLDPTCGSGTTAYVAEQWGRRWITIDTSRVALALARARIMGARYPFYTLADSREGQLALAAQCRTAPAEQPTYGHIAHGFVCERVPHITLKAIANNEEIDAIWDRFQPTIEALRGALNTALKTAWQEWEIPREAAAEWPAEARTQHAEWWRERLARQREIDASIAARAEYETLYNRPYEDKTRVRVAGPFTVESLSPHRVLSLGEASVDEGPDPVAQTRAGAGQGYVPLILENLRRAGVQQPHKEGKIEFTALEPRPGDYVCAEAHFLENGEGGREGGRPRRAAIFIGPEFGTVTRVDLVAAANEAIECRFDVLIACAFNYDAPATAFSTLGGLPILKARMNADLHMAEDLKATGQGNLFVVFGELDVEVHDAAGRLLPVQRDENGRDFIEAPAGAGEQLCVKLNGIDLLNPNTGEVRSDDTDGIACWFLDTDYDAESFFVRHAYFLGANDPYTALKTTLKAEIDAEAWETLRSDTSRPFPVPATRRFAVKVINHLGDEVMKVFRLR